MGVLISEATAGRIALSAALGNIALILLFGIVGLIFFIPPVASLNVFLAPPIAVFSVYMLTRSRSASVIVAAILSVLTLAWVIFFVLNN